MSDVVKTMSYVEKIISDIIQTTSDLFLPIANVWKTNHYKRHSLQGYFLEFQYVMQFWGRLRFQEEYDCIAMWK